MNTAVGMTAKTVSEPISETWARLAGTSEIAGMFASQEWHDIWLRHVAGGEPGHVVTSVDEHGRVRGIAPLCHVPYRDLFMRVPCVQFSGRDVVSGDYLDWLAAPEDRDAVAADMLAALDRELESGRLVVLGEIIKNSHTDRTAKAWLESNGLDFRVQEERRCPHMELPGDYDEYLGNLKSKFRGAVRRKSRRLLEAVDLVALTDREEVAEHLPHLYRLHEIRWKGRGEAGTFVRPGFQEFLEDFVRNGPASVQPRLYLLRDQGRFFASLLVFHCEGHAAMHYQGGWDPSSAHMKHSPGIVLTAHSIKSAIEAGLTSFDFLRGDEAYKLDFGTTFRYTHTYVIAKRGVRARAYMALCSLKEWAKRRRAALA